MLKRIKNLDKLLDQELPLLLLLLLVVLLRIPNFFEPYWYGDEAIYLAVGQSEVFLGRDLMKKKRISQSSAKLIDQEVKKIVNDAYKTATKMLKKNIDVLHKVSERLIEAETIDGSYIDEALGKVAQVS